MPVKEIIVQFFFFFTKITVIQIVVSYEGGEKQSRFSVEIKYLIKNKFEYTKQQEIEKISIKIVLFFIKKSFIFFKLHYT